MTLLRRTKILAAKIETTAGAAETLAASDATFNVFNANIQPGIQMAQRERQGSFAMLQAIPGQYVGTATFQTDIEWDGSATEPAWAETFLPACGWVKSGGTYSPSIETPGTNVKTLTIGTYVTAGSGDALYKELRGCVGNFNIVCPTGQRAYIDWTFQGAWTGASDETQLSPTHTTAAITRYATATTQFNSNDLCVSQIAYNSGNVITAKECATTVAGIDYFLITSRQPTATADPESDLVANADHYGGLLAETQAELTTTMTCGTGDDTLELEFKSAQIQNIQEGDRGGMVTDQLTFQANYNASTEFNIIFTANV